VHLFAENFDVEMWNSDRIMEIDGKFRNKPFCCIKGPKCGSSHFFYTRVCYKNIIYIYTLKIILIGQIKLNDRFAFPPATQKAAL